MRSAISILLFFFPIHFIFIKLKNFFYDNNLLSSAKINSTVISVGNISLGGSGKTPFTISLSNFLYKKGFSVGIVTRGYGRKDSCDDFLLDNHSWRECGDEALVIKNNISKSIPVYISKNKIYAAKELSKMGCDIIVLDDAFQHRKIFRDIDIVLLSPDELMPKNQKTFPYGLLREPFSNIDRADLIISTKANLYNENNSAKSVLSLKTNFHDQLLCSIKNSKINIKEVSKMDGLLSICGIGKPESFHNSLKSLDIKPLESLTFPDHHNFNKKDIDSLVRKIKKGGITAIICTEKDWVKLISFMDDIVIPIYAIRLNYSLNKDIEESILRLL